MNILSIFYNLLPIKNDKIVICIEILAQHDVVAIQVYDKRVAELPDVGLLKVHDAETGQERIIDTSSRAVREAQARWWKQQSMRLKDTFSRSKVDAVSVRTDQDYVSVLRSLFANRK